MLAVSDRQMHRRFWGVGDMAFLPALAAVASIAGTAVSAAKADDGKNDAKNQMRKERVAANAKAARLRKARAASTDRQSTILAGGSLEQAPNGQQTRLLGG